ncbi:NADP-dependent oxidoreductase, partial [Candidatus Poribacteria bacterium]|nr:NADP-dependent oxidoreductase [Candidatus Poribacteria bacterium]
MSERVSRSLVLVSRPVGVPKESDFRIKEAAIPDLAEGQFLVRNIYISVDPYMRGMMRGVEIGSTPSGGAVGQVVESRNADFAEGSLVVSNQSWREHALCDSAERIDPQISPLSAYLGVVGMPGFTGWYGLTRIGQPQPGETVVVSAAAGAVGSLAGQIAKIKGCRVVGTAGGPEKCAHLTDDLGFDAAIDYRAADDLPGALREACPDGIDVYYENVGGPMLEAVLGLVNQNARIPVCGMISVYNNEEPEPGPRNMFALIYGRVLMQGFIISDHVELADEFRAEVTGWIKDGRVTYRETVVEGLEAAPGAFIDLFSGRNLG